VLALTDAQQQTQTQYSYEPSGATMQTGLADPNMQQYTGRENDGTGLYYYRNRYYSPGAARFDSSVKTQSVTRVGRRMRMLTPTAIRCIQRSVWRV